VVSVAGGGFVGSVVVSVAVDGEFGSVVFRVAVGGDYGLQSSKCCVCGYCVGLCSSWRDV